MGAQKPPETVCAGVWAAGSAGDEDGFPKAQPAAQTHSLSGESAPVLFPSWRRRVPLSGAGRYAEHKHTGSPKVLLPGCRGHGMCPPPPLQPSSDTLGASTGLKLQLL